MAPPAKRPAKTKETAGSMLAQRIVAAQLPSSPKDARAKVSAWLSEIADEAGKSLKKPASAESKEPPEVESEGEAKKEG